MSMFLTYEYNNRIKEIAKEEKTRYRKKGLEHTVGCAQCIMLSWKDKPNSFKSWL